MKLTHRVIEVPTKRTFRISQEAHDAYRMVIARLEHDGVIGYGESSPAQRVTGETPESVGRFLDKMAAEIVDVAPNDWDTFLDHAHQEFRNEPSARCALDLAVHDLVGKLQGVPARRLYPDVPDGRLETCMTVSLDEPDAMAAEAKSYRDLGFRALKLKLGDAAGDLARVEAVRAAVPDARLRADANTGWTLEEARRLVQPLADIGMEFLEQPFRPEQDAHLAKLSQESPLVLYADESVKDAEDVRRLHALGLVGGVNLKLQKTGGLRPAVAALKEARELGYRVQIGCNVETSVGIAGGVQLIGLLDHADLDGHLLLAEQPFRGPMPVDGWYETPRAPGLGVAPAAEPA